MTGKVTAAGDGDNDSVEKTLNDNDDYAISPCVVNCITLHDSILVV